jgi:DNA-binding transcriptional ArsR family regulator
MPHGISQKVRVRAYEILKYMEKEAPCTTIAKIGEVFNLSWSQARVAFKILTDDELVVELKIGDKMIWCIDEKAAANEIYALKRELWRILCEQKRKFVTTSTIAKWIINDPTARKIFSRYVDTTKINIAMLKLIAAILKELVGKPIDRTARKTLYYIPRNLCEKEPRHEDVTINHYKQTRNNVSIKVPTPMYQDILAAADSLGISVAELVRMAILRLITQYRHVLDGKR